MKSCSLGRATRFSLFQFICNFPRAKNPHAKAESSLTNRNNASLILANFLWAIITHSKASSVLVSLSLSLSPSHSVSLFSLILWIFWFLFSYVPTYQIRKYVRVRRGALSLSLLFFYEPFGSCFLSRKFCDKKVSLSPPPFFSLSMYSHEFYFIRHIHT